jgi:phage terminase large subunit
MIASRARSSKPGVTPIVRAGTNPGGPGASWVRSWFLQKDVSKADYPSYDPAQYAYIAATLDDNPHIDPGYEASLLDLPEALRRAYRYGDWDIFEGQFFSEWRRDRHVGTVPIPDGCQWVRCVDWGYSKPGWCGWFACLPDGRAYLAWEYLFRQTIASEVAHEIRRRTTELVRGGKVRYTVADTAMWTPDGQTGESIAETFARAGVPMVQADKDRVNGWQRLRAWLRDAPDGKPWMVVSPDCHYAIRTIPALVMDVHKPEDVDSDGEDHAADAIRYFCMSRPSPTREDTKPRCAPGSLGWWKTRVKKNAYAH